MRFGSLPGIALTTVVAATLTLAHNHAASAQTCWAYVDSQQAKLPLSCVQQGNPSATCSWNSSCHLDGNPSDCCVARPASTPQTILRMHTNWHNCFGNVGAPIGQNPPGRSMRWYAFHRQFEIDYNQWREGISFPPIESVEWCPNMLLSKAQGGAGLTSGAHPAGCGVGPNRPANEPCPSCEAFPQCMFKPGAGPAACATAPSTVCGAPTGTVLPYSNLDQFPNVDQIAEVLDAYFHGDMHGAVATANCLVSGNCYNTDATSPSCSPRDPMFWRLHKAIDDVVRAWQDSKAVDVVVVVDTSGSMSEPDATGISKLQAAVNAVDIFGDLLEDTRDDGQTNRIGVVTFASGAATALPMTPVTPALRAPGGAFRSALDGIIAGGPTGCTGIGGGIERALQLLCPPTGDCSEFAADGDNDRKAILLLTDGLENRPPCMVSAGPTPSGTCGSQCFGPELDYSRLGLTQLVSVGFGDAGSLNGPVLTLVSERQGGVYLQNPNSPGTDLKHYFVKAFGQVSGESVMIDPEGTLATASPATPMVKYNSCGDSALTFSAVWDKAVDPADLRLLVTSPSGDLVVAGPQVESSSERLWSHVRVNMPYRAARSGLWRAELIRPHSNFVNGFAPMAFADVDEGTDLVRRQIHRLCPDGCKRVLYYENGFESDSVYARALKLDLNAGLISGLETVKEPAKFAELLGGGNWSLVISAQGGEDRAYPFDALLEKHLCSDGRAIISDSRPKSAARLLRCAGALFGGASVGKVIAKSASMNIASDIVLRDPGNPKENWSLISIAPSQAIALSAPGDRVAIVARSKQGLEQKWFIDVLGRGLSKITPVSFKSKWTTNDRILVGARVLPSYMRAGGYDHVDARVEVEYPLVGLGEYAARRKVDALKQGAESAEGRGALLTRTNIPTAKIVIPLNDDGVDGDQEPGNYYWTGSLDKIRVVDGHYALRFIFDFTADGCTTRREANQSMIVQAVIDPNKTKIEPQPQGSTSDGWRRTDLLITPFDRPGNLLGPELQRALSCAPAKLCRLDPKTVVDRGDGSYTLTVESAPGVASVKVKGFGGEFVVAPACDDCGVLKSVSLNARNAKEHGKLVGTITLSSPAPSNEMGGAVVYLSSSDHRLVELPETIVVPAGKTEAVFNAEVLHLVDKQPKRVRISATYGARTIEAPLLVIVEEHADAEKTKFKPDPSALRYPHRHVPK